MVSLSRKIPRARALVRHEHARSDRSCNQCWGVLHIWHQHHAQVAGNPVLVQKVVCLHCNARYARSLPIPARSRVGEVLVGLALLLFASLRLPGWR